MSLIDTARLSRLSDGVNRAKAYKDILAGQINNLENDEKDFRYKADLHQKCTEIFKKWLEDSLEKNIHSIADLGTAALQHIIHDQNLKFQIHQEQKLNRVTMRFLVEENGVSGDPLSSFGGGAAVVLSFVLRLAVMARMKMVNLLLLDESVVALANAYVPAAAEFMRRLSEETGVNILMVTHNPEFLNYAHIAYEGHKDSCLKLRRIKTSV